MQAHFPIVFVRRSTTEFVHLAPGLTDLIELAARSSVLDQSVDESGSQCGDDLSVNGLNSLPGSAVKPRAARRPPSINPGSATKTRVAPAARASASRTARASRPSYAESDDLDSDLEEDSESDDSDSSESESEEEDTTAEAVRDATMSPTKQFVLTSTGKTKKVTTKGRSGVAKKISFADGSDSVPAKGRKDTGKKAVTNENEAQNYW